MDANLSRKADMLALTRSIVYLGRRGCILYDFERGDRVALLQELTGSDPRTADILVHLAPPLVQPPRTLHVLT